MTKQTGKIILVASLIFGSVGYIVGRTQFEPISHAAANVTEVESAGIVASATSASFVPDDDEWAPTKPSPKHDVYYPGTEELKPDEMRVICCGSGMPMPRLKQAAASFVIELGNGDKFIFDMGTGAMHRIFT